MDAAFKAFRQFNAEPLRLVAGSRARIDSRALPCFASERLPDRIARALAERRAMPFKEVLESFELFERVRRRLRATEVADLCCGHGLTGLLFAAFERDVARVTLLDRRRPPSFDTVREAVAEIVPRLEGRVRYVEAPVTHAPGLLAPGTSIVGVHACGVRTDRCLDAALAVGGAVAVMPCCYAQTAAAAPRALRRALGAELATDVHRTYRLEAAGYEVAWSAIPAAVTAKNRIIVGTPGS